jgi:WD40 repeat protein
MSTREAETPDDLLAALLARYDEALAAGLGPGPGSVDVEGLAPESLSRLRADQEVLALLERVWPRRPAGETPREPGPDGQAAARPVQLGRFLIERELGRGGFGVVYLATDPQLGRQVALKVPRPEALVTPELRRRFLREARAAGGLEHPNIVTIFDSGEVGALCYLVSAYCRGGTLAEHLRTRLRPMAADEAAELVAALADAVEHAHRRGILHRDIKPANVLLDPPAEGTPRVASLDFVPRLADFGLARFLTRPEADGPSGNATAAEVAPTEATTAGGALLGTPEYMAPEQAAGPTGQVSEATDVYGLGALLYAVLTGRAPFTGADRADVLRRVVAQEPHPPRALRRDVPRDLEAVCLKCLEKEPAKRYASAAALAADLRRFLDGKPTEARPLGMARRLLKWVRRRPARAASMFLALLAVAALPAGAAWYEALQGDHEEDLRQAAQREQEQAAEAARLREGVRREREGRYAQDVSDAGRAIEKNDYRRAAALVKGQRPADGQDDLRGFEWHFLQRISQRYVRTLNQAGNAALALALSPDGKQLAVGLAGGGLELWDTARWQKIEPRRVHQLSVNTVAYSPDGRILAAGGGEPGQRGWIKLWDGPALARERELTGHPGRTWLMAQAIVVQGIVPLGASSPVIAHGFVSLGIAGLDASTMAHPRPVNAVAFDPAGKRLVSINGGDGRGPNSPVDAEVRAWDVASGKCLETLSPKPAGVELNSLVWSPQLHKMLCGYWSAPGWVDCFDPNDLGRGLHLLLNTGRSIQALACSPDGGKLAVAHFDGSVEVVALKGPLTLRVLPIPAPPAGAVQTLAWSPDGDCLASGYANGIVALRYTGSWELTERIAAHSSAIRALVFLPGGLELVSAGDDGAVKVWRVNPVLSGWALARDLKQAWWVAFSPDGQHLFAGGDDHTARRWAMGANRREMVFRGHESLLAAGAVSPDGRWLATAGFDHTVRLWDTDTGRMSQTLTGPGHKVRGVAFSPDNKLVACCGEDGVVHVWAVATGAFQWKSYVHPRSVYGVSFHPRGQVLATGGSDHTVELWDAATGGKPLRTLPETSMVRCVAYSPDGALLAVAMSDGTVKLRGAETGETLWSGVGHSRPVRALAFSPAGKTLASAGEDGLIKLWHTSTGQELLTLRANEKTVSGLSFSPDGQTLASAHHDGTVRLWLAPGNRESAPP